jgi:DNA adenine methylase
MTPRKSVKTFETPRPFLKWVGGKGQLLGELLERIDKAGDFGRYHEPFVGGGALFYALYRAKHLKEKAWLSDYNPRLITTYEGVKLDVEEVIRSLHKHKNHHSETYYYKVREQLRDDVSIGAKTPAPEHAARIIYMNKTGYNGLYRENNKGLYNVPFGRYKNPLICDENNLRACSKALSKVKLYSCHFDEIINRAEPDDLVYFDPPYVPVSKTSAFTGYSKDGFGEDSQKLLANICEELNAKGVKFLLSNSYTDSVRDLYKKFKVEEVSANRNINSNASKRGAVSEALVRNF